jgi:hypothetical protein
MLISSSSPVLLPSEDAVEKHLTGRHAQSSHAGGASGLPEVADTPAKEGRNPKAVAAAIKLRDRANKLDKAVTAQMQRIEKASGGKLIGLATRKKETDSMAAKIEKDANESYDGDIDKAASEISDASRYTLELSEENYVAGAVKAVKGLESMGYEVVPKNFWQKGDDYQGINIKLKSKNGHLIELQLHTPESFRVKTFETHELYKKYSFSTDPVEKKVFWDKMVSISDAIPLPQDYDKLLELGKLVQHKFTL